MATTLFDSFGRQDSSNFNSLLVDSVDAAAMLGISERAFYDLIRRDHDLAVRAKCVLGPRASRYKTSVLREWVDSHPASKPVPQPERLARGRAAARVARDPAAAWIGNRAAI